MDAREILAFVDQDFHCFASIANWNVRLHSTGVFLWKTDHDRVSLFLVMEREHIGLSGLGVADFQENRLWNGHLSNTHWMNITWSNPLG